MTLNQDKHGKGIKIRINRKEIFKKYNRKKGVLKLKKKRKLKV